MNSFARRMILAIATIVGMLGSLGAVPASLGVPPAADHVPIPHADPAFIEQVPGAECTYDDPAFESVAWTEGRYGDACKRINFHFGPITVKPGENDALLQPVTIEKPAYDGYVVRFKPDLVTSVTGAHPPTENMHLHHATWLNGGDSYGSGPFFAAGEEKTIGNFPDGYGMEVGATDPWLLLYMVHNAGATTEEVYLRYTIDYVEKSAGDALGITPIKPIWLDVQGNRIHPDAPSTGANPVFNVQRGFGHIDPEIGTRVCTWPKENCARFDVYGDVTPQQGVDVSDEVQGTDWEVPADLAGTLVALGGHLHPGGIRDEVSLVRGEQEEMIFLSDALYWNHDDPTKLGGPPTSWNLSMTASSIQTGWAVKIREGDKIRINAVVDSQLASWYEGMGIVVAFVVPDGADEDIPSVDVFTDNVVVDRGYPEIMPIPEGPWFNDWRPEPCTPDLVGADGEKRLCLRGGPTHGQLPETGNTGTCEPNCPPLPDVEGELTTDIYSVGLTYGNADFGVIGVTGIPKVQLGEPVRMWNLDAPARIWHTFTRCKEPCTGATTVNYPIANGGSGDPNDEMDFESMEIGFGTFFEPARSQIGGDQEYDQQWVEDAVFWDFTPTETGTFTFFCRVHPGMRGAFEVVE